MGKFIIYPNPAKKDVTIQFDNIFRYSSIEIMDITGRIVLTKDYTVMDNILFDVSQLTKGIYTIIVKDNHQIISSKKLIKE